MRSRSGQLLQLASLVLALLVLTQFLRGIFRVSAFFGINIPAVPTLSTNSIAGSNPTPAPTNPRLSSVVTPKGPLAQSPTGSLTVVSTNLGASGSAGTNITSRNLVSSNLVFKSQVSTNLVSANSLSTNIVRRTGTNSDLAAGSNSAPKSSQHIPPPMMLPGGIGFAGMPGMPGNLPALPADIQARLDKIVESGFLAPVIHPLPMGLLGIAGNTAFLRADSGQTGLVKEGDSLGDVKLLRIGINRVLVERAGKQEELTIFDGYGGDSLLSQKDKSSK